MYYNIYLYFKCLRRQCDKSAAPEGGTGAALCTRGGGTRGQQGGGAGGTAAVLAALSPCPINVNWDHLANELENVLVQNWHQNMFWG
jgi:hypothetical protein